MPRDHDALYRAIKKGGASAAEPRDGGPAVTAASPRGLHARDCRSAPLLGRAKDAVMRGGDTANRPGGDELTARVFRALYRAYELHSVEGVHVVVPRGTPCFAGSGLGDVARQISDHEQGRAGRAE